MLLLWELMWGTLPRLYVRAGAGVTYFKLAVRPRPTFRVVEVLVAGDTRLQDLDHVVSHGSETRTRPHSTIVDNFLCAPTVNARPGREHTKEGKLFLGRGRVRQPRPKLRIAIPFQSLFCLHHACHGITSLANLIHGGRREKILHLHDINSRAGVYLRPQLRHDLNLFGTRHNRCRHSAHVREHGTAVLGSIQVYMDIPTLKMSRGSSSHSTGAGVQEDSKLYGTDALSHDSCVVPVQVSASLTGTARRPLAMCCVGVRQDSVGSPWAQNNPAAAADEGSDT